MNLSFRAALGFISIACVVVLGRTPEVAAQTCQQFNPANWDVSTDHRINYYIHDKFGERLRECTPNPDDDTELTNSHIDVTVQHAAEMWNMQALGALFVRKGSFTSATDCSAVTAPALLVEFRQSCRDIDEDETCDQDYIWATIYGTTCNDVARLVVWGHPTDIDCLDAQGDPKSDSYDWVLGDGSPVSEHSDLLVNIAHEMGHALEIEHPSGAPAPEDYALVNSGSDRALRHLHGYDQACADDNNAGREVEYHWKGIDDDGVFESTVDSNGLTHTRGMVSGGHFSWSSGASERYAVYLDTKIRHEAVDTAGGFAFTLNPVTLDTDLADRRTAPTGVSMLEFSTMSSVNRFLWNEDYYSDDLPDIYYSRDKANGEPFFSDVATYKLKRCNNGTCTSTTDMVGHIPVSTAWDEHSETTVVARVKSNRNSIQGDIILYPGFYGTSIQNLRVGSKLTGSGPTETFDTWSYSFKTDFPVGLACAPTQDDLDYNCLLAWQDRGIPDGSILYKYFRVNPSTKVIEWRSGSASKRAGSLSASGVQAAYFDGSFWMAWKRAIVNGGDINHTRTTSATCYTCWSGYSAHYVGEVGDPPTWFYVPHQTHESALIWTEPN